jgi:hypothetical protein
MVDSRVRVQSNPSPVDHEQNTLDLINGLDFFKIKNENCLDFYTRSCPFSVSLPCLTNYTSSFFYFLMRIYALSYNLLQVTSPLQN